MFKKLIFGIAWIGILVLSLGGICLGLMPKYLSMVDMTGWNFRGVLIGLGVVYLLLFIEKFISLFEKPKDYEVVTDNGRLRISPTTVNNLVKEVIDDYQTVKSVKISNKIKGKRKVIVNLALEAYSTPELQSELQEIQKEVKEKITRYLEVEVAEVRIKVKKVLKGKKNKIVNDKEEVIENTTFSNETEKKTEEVETPEVEETKEEVLEETPKTEEVKEEETFEKVEETKGEETFEKVEETKGEETFEKVEETKGETTEEVKEEETFEKVEETKEETTEEVKEEETFEKVEETKEEKAEVKEEETVLDVDSEKTEEKK